MVAAELGVGTLERRVSHGLRLLDTIAVSLLALVVLGRVLGLCATNGSARKLRTLHPGRVRDILAISTD